MSFQKKKRLTFFNFFSGIKKLGHFICYNDTEGNHEYSALNPALHTRPSQVPVSTYYQNLLITPAATRPHHQ
ncbi:MAG: hypothetical protein JWQ57_4097 [Mucilaginibacter sp.]|nr:hypothetical protein [Mucilaginibacter sp.]